MPNSLKYIVVFGLLGLTAACAPPPVEYEPIMVPVVEEEPMGKY